MAGPQSKSKTVHIRIPREVCKAVDREARRLSITRAAALRKILAGELGLPEPAEGGTTTDPGCEEPDEDPARPSYSRSVKRFPLTTCDRNTFTPKHIPHRGTLE